eukprot:TRINITY_DN25992_c0_g1_i1.p1 TRINITY_DN25992_c0_g1~~TRINITY_DN25992_c0_g1_i1.p1  ORF type:complete len:838 (-),score=104.78 TRINITY_DN25992_c0_g1_i1:517-3030(-)
MTLKIPLMSDVASGDGGDVESPSSTKIGTEYTPFSDISKPSSASPTTTSPSSTEDKIDATCSYRFLIALLFGFLLLFLFEIESLQRSGALTPMFRIGRSWFHGGTKIPDGYCSAASAPLSVLPPANSSISSFTAWAQKLVTQLTPEERHRLINGAGYKGSDAGQGDGFYVGNALAVPRLGIPSIRMQDAAQGFRTTDARMVGQVTAWPCGLAIAAGWDENATWHWARALAQEFRAKGANVLLGPAVNVHRVAANGRNAEYISGEDPMLGVRLAPAYVRGAQEGVGIAAVVKHFVLNQQETNRMAVDSQVDERTRWEQYYPPFEAAVQAGVAAVMCSYNLVNGEHACENSETITTDLKGRMGFSGWVMSDWWAMATDKGARAGTDQDMPGSDGFFSNSTLSALPPSRLDDMATRILTGMSSSGAWTSVSKEGDSCRAGCNCGPLLYGVNATSSEHSTLACTLAAGSAVLLKNSPRQHLSRTNGMSTLPLRAGERVAVLGGACAQQPDAKAMVDDFMAGDYYVVGGSGRVLSERSVSILQGLRNRGLRLTESTSDSMNAAVKAMQDADVAIICGGATSSEGVDRTSLRLDNEAFLMKALQHANDMRIPAVVVALAPGAIVAPWRHSASAALAMFLSGQETGNAAADVLMGDITPSGKLPVTFPAKEEDALWPCPTTLLPWENTACPYKERLKGGWHIYDGKPVAYPFGHGLSYTQFEYSAEHNWIPSGSEARQLRVRVKNTGSVPGAEVVQLYLRFPHEEADEPDMVLRGFEKTPVLRPGDSHEVVFILKARDLSVWDTSTHSWRQPVGRFVTMVGASSRDMRLCGAFQGLDVEPIASC